MNKIIKLEARLIKKESKKEHIKALKPVKSNFKFQAESKSLMYLHRKNMHLRDTGTQTLEINRNNIFTQTDPMLPRCDEMFQTDDDVEIKHFVKYPFHYCGLNIANIPHLHEHCLKCLETRNRFIEPGLPNLPALSPSAKYLQC